LLYDEVIYLMQKISAEFANIIQLESIGKTGEARDIWMMNVDATDYFKQKNVS
jgi:hypothetical protein